MIFVKLFRQSRGKKVTALRFSFPWSIVWYKHKSLKDGVIKQFFLVYVVFRCMCVVVEVIKTNQDVKT